MPIPDLDPIYPAELSLIEADELNSVEALRLIRKSIDHPYYREKSGAAGSFLEILDQKIKSVPGMTFSKEIKTEIEAIRAIGQFWQISSWSPEQVKSFISAHALPIFESEYTEINKVITMLLLSKEVLPDYIIRWLDALTNGLRTATELISTKRIKIYTGATVDPTIGNWIDDYEKFATNHPSSGNVMIAEYIAKSPNVQDLPEEEIQLLNKLFNWFNILRFEEGPVLSVQGEEKITPVNQVPDGFVRPINKLYSNQFSPAGKPAIPAPDNIPSQPSKTEEQIVQASLTNSQNLIRHFETIEKELPALQKSSVAQLATLADQALAKGDSGRAVAGFFQIVRELGMEPILTEASMIRVMRSAVLPYLQSAFQLSSEIASRAVDLPTNRLIMLKEFLRLLFNKAAGSENDAARLMVHLASLMPEGKVGPEATFAYFDLGAEGYRWAKTDIRPEDGLMSSKIV